MQKKLQSLLNLRRFARGVMVFGFLCSAGGNVLHAQKTPVDIAIALAAPTILMAAFELVSRVPIRKEAHWMVVTLRILATGFIASIMAVVSYFHQRDAIFAETGDQLAAYLLPIAVDALMIVGSISLIELNVQIRQCEDALAAAQAVAERAKSRGDRKIEPPAPVEPTGSKSERIAAVLAAFPELSIREVAEKAQTSYNYAHRVITGLRTPNDQELPIAA